MSRVFGEVAALYDDLRPGYPEELLDTLKACHGGVPASAADLGAGTGKSTELLLKWGVPVIAVEPDPRMAEILARKFPAAEVVNATFEQWSPPPGGVGLIGCATAWQQSPADQQLAVANLGAAIDGWGGTLRLDLHTVLVLARATAG